MSPAADHRYRLPGGLPSRLRSLRPSCGPVRLVGVDGHAGSGKSTLARVLAAELGNAPVVHLDDLASHDALFGWTGRLSEQVLRPLGRGERAVYEVYDWHRGMFGTTEVLEPAPVVLVEGVGAGRRAVRRYLALLIWVDVPREEAWERGRRRDGPELSAFWRRWQEAERRHFAGDPSRPEADILLRPTGAGYRECV
ncbi:hypothetical protein GCM10009716_00440 [Streptomyces sodiiphilus]|uniref:Uridine kinase n=1 Tax=Streptomyces sodiiphilus TaxID=226217 RepID=A0ABN2NTA7_9ACTN